RKPDQGGVKAAAPGSVKACRPLPPTTAAEAAIHARSDRRRRPRSAVRTTSTPGAIVLRRPRVRRWEGSVAGDAGVIAAVARDHRLEHARDRRNHALWRPA